MLLHDDDFQRRGCERGNQAAAFYDNEAVYRRVAVAELAAAVETPALHREVFEQRTGVTATGSDVDRRVGNLVGVETEVDRTAAVRTSGADAEAAVAVVPPAEHAAVVADGTGVVITDDHLLRRVADAKVDRMGRGADFSQEGAVTDRWCRVVALRPIRHTD